MHHESLNGQLLKPILEASYLTAENAWRYRAILRYFYIQHERLRHYLLPEEVYEHLKASQYFANYTEEQLQQDLNQLVNWGNLIPRQETGRVSTIQEFKRRRFRYQCTPYTVEIERMVQNLENMVGSMRGSLERTLFERLLEALLRLTRTLPAGSSSPYAVGELSPEETNRLWEDVYDDFRKLTENATDYLAHLESEKVEELMRTEVLLVYKDTLTEYLRQFMVALQQSSLKIEAVLQNTPPELVKLIAAAVATYQLSIPRLDAQPERHMLEQRVLGQWQSLKSWFLGVDGQESDQEYLQKQTNEAIRRITRFAQRLGERHHNLRSRRQEYLDLATWFADIEDIDTAHRVAACVFGAAHTRHLYADVRLSEDIDGTIWDEAPTVLITKPRIRQYRFRTRLGAIVAHGAEKTDLLQEYLDQKAAESQLLESIVNKNQIILRELPPIESHVRKTLLAWIERCMAAPDGVAKTESGRKIQLSLLGDEYITLRCEDGTMQMPNFCLRFLE
jgi:uncharacterized protein (TIGR02677 family)